MGKFISYKRLKKIIKEEKNTGKRIVLTGGCFDILHRGHLYLLKKAKEYGDILIVNIVNDKRVKIYKGEKRPINTAFRRVTLVSKLEMVNYATVHPSIRKGPTTELALLIKPDIMVQFEGKWKSQDSKRLEKLLGYGVELKSVKNSPFKISTTKIIDDIIKDYGNPCMIHK